MTDELAGVDGCEEALARTKLPRQAVQKINRFIKAGLSRRDEERRKAHAYAELGSALAASVDFLGDLADKLEGGALGTAEAVKALRAERLRQYGVLSEVKWKR